MKSALYLCFALCVAWLLSGCLPIGIRGQNLPFAGQAPTPPSATANPTGAF